VISRSQNDTGHYFSEVESRKPHEDFENRFESRKIFPANHHFDRRNHRSRRPINNPELQLFSLALIYYLVNYYLFDFIYFYIFIYLYIYLLFIYLLLFLFYFTFLLFLFFFLTIAGEASCPGHPCRPLLRPFQLPTTVPSPISRTILQFTINLTSSARIIIYYRHPSSATNSLCATMAVPPSRHLFPTKSTQSASTSTIISLHLQTPSHSPPQLTRNLSNLTALSLHHLSHTKSARNPHNHPCKHKAITTVHLSHNKTAPKSNIHIPKPSRRQKSPKPRTVRLTLPVHKPRRRRNLLSLAVATLPL
jgi:hypothetical protein